jgi:hypothetical protein
VAHPDAGKVSSVVWVDATGLEICIKKDAHSFWALEGTTTDREVDTALLLVKISE